MFLAAVAAKAPSRLLLSVLQHPGVLGASTLARVHDQRPALQGNPRQAAGHEAHLVADQNERLKSTWRGANPASTRVGQVDNASVG